MYEEESFDQPEDEIKYLLSQPRAEENNFLFHPQKYGEEDSVNFNHFVKMEEDNKMCFQPFSFGKASYGNIDKVVPDFLMKIEENAATLTNQREGMCTAVPLPKFSKTAHFSPVYH